MTVKTAVLAQQQIERSAAVPALRRRITRRQQFAFVATLGVVEAAWVLLLVALARLFV
jgi:hypothetical protein